MMGSRSEIVSKGSEGHIIGHGKRYKKGSVESKRETHETIKGENNRRRKEGE